MNHQIQKIFSLLFLLLFANTLAEASVRDSLQEKIDKVAMRRLGHELLQCVGDFESRVLPIEKIGEQYKIVFEREFAIDPDDLISTIDEILIKDALPTNNYLVEVEQCDTKEIIHSFVIGKFNRSNLIPCSGRILPQNCYHILITIFDIQHLYVQPPNPDSNTSSFPFLSLFLAVGFISVIILLFYFRKRPQKEVDHIITIGAFTFDKKNQTLSYQNQSSELSTKEAELLLLLHANLNDTVKRETLLSNVWGDEGDYVGRTLDVFISKLRKKLAADTRIKIVNVRAVGYKLVV
jgi:hypothetical protein